jgi:hypothetical protein
MGAVVDKNDPTVRLDKFTTRDVNRAITQEHRVIPNLTGAGSTASSADHPTIAAYLDAEAALGFAFAYMDQTQLVTQMIT